MAPLVLSGCSSVTIKDEIVYGNKGPLGAVEFHTLTTSQINFSKAQWDQILLTEPLICTSVQTFADYKAAIEQLCSVCNCCSYNTQTALETFFTKVASIKASK